MVALTHPMPAPQPLSILLLQTDTHIGGTEMMNFRVWQALSARGHHVDVCCLDGIGPLDAQYRAAGYEPTYLESKQRSALRVLHDLRRVLREKQYDLVHIFGLRANLFGRIAAHAAPNTRIITGQRSIDTWRKRYHNLLDRLTSRRVDHFIANSHAVARWLHETVGLSASRISVVHSGIDAKPFTSAARGTIRQAYQLPPGALIVTCVANLRPAKGHDMLLQALPALQPPRPTYLLLVGDGPLRAELEMQLPPSQCQVHFLGHRTDVPAILADSDIFVLASAWEGLPGAVLEAMASGLPVVATDVGGVPELVVNGTTGLLVPAGDSAEMTAALDTLLNSPGLRAKMGHAGRERVAQHFTLAQSVTALEKIYFSVVNPAEQEVQIAL
jgi:glycosyltransferase involved in cell wall biosynthesis